MHCSVAPQRTIHSGVASSQGSRTDEFRSGDRRSPEFMASRPRHVGRAGGSGGRDHSSARSAAERIDSRSRAHPPRAGRGHRVPDSPVLPHILLSIVH